MRNLNLFFSIKLFQGVLHEQAREDRDKHIEIIEENIQKNMTGQFTKVHYPQFSDYGIPYNYFSVMHFPSYAFSKNGAPTIVPKVFCACASLEVIAYTRMYPS